MKFNFQNYQHPNEWALSSITYHPTQNLYYLVGTAGDVMTITNACGFGPIQVQGYLGEWQLSMICFDKQDQMWGVNFEGWLGKWDSTTSSWQRMLINGADWRYKMVAFDQDGTFWAVKKDGTLVKQAGDDWIDYGRPNNWGLNWISFNPDDTTKVVMVGDQNNFGMYSLSSKKMETIPSNWERVKCFSFESAKRRVLTVGMKNDLGASGY